MKIVHEDGKDNSVIFHGDDESVELDLDTMYLSKYEFKELVKFFQRAINTEEARNED